MNKLIREIIDISPMLPGTLEKHYNVCGKHNRICKDKKSPKKHGPYYRVSFSLKGENSSISVKEKDLKLVRKLTEAYKAQRDIPLDLGLKFMNLCKEKGFAVASQEFTDYVIDAKRKLIGIKASSTELKECKNSQVKWKEKAIERQEEIVSKNVKITNLLDSRSKWKEKYQNVKTENKIVGQEIEVLKKQLKDQEILISEQEKKNS